MGVLMKSGSALNDTPSRPESGVAVVAEAAEVISEGKLLVTGVATSSLGLGPGILKRGYRRLLGVGNTFAEAVTNQRQRGGTT